MPKTTKTKYDIVIVGAGPIGASLALALSSLPLRIALIEANPHIFKTPEKDSRPLALTYGSSQILTGIGVWPDLMPQATPIASVHVSNKNHFGFTRIHAAEENKPALGYVIPAQNLFAELTQKIKNLPQLHLFHPATITALHSMDSGWQITLQNQEEITTSLICAADGTHSTVRQSLNIATEVKEYDQSAIVTLIHLARDHKNIAYERFIENGALAMLPLSDQSCGCVWTADNAQINALKALSDQEFLQHVQHYFGYRLGRLQQVGPRQTFPLKRVWAKECIKPGLVLLGNAAHTLHPVAAQGFNLGLGDIAVLAQCIADSVRSGKNLSDITLLNQYLALRDKETQWIMNFTHTIIQIFSHDFLPLTLARNGALLALNHIGPLKRQLAKRLMGIHGKLPNLTLGLPL